MTYDADTIDDVMKKNKALERLAQELTDAKLQCDSDKSRYESAFNRIKEIVVGIVETGRWALRLGAVGASLWTLGWRFSTGVGVFIIADELLCWAKREAGAVKP